jgi:adenosylcobyric acid synthase
VVVRWVTEPADVADADVVVLPGTKATVADLEWLRAGGLAESIAAHARAGRPLLGICGGFQMLCRQIDDPVESRAGRVDGLGVLDVDIAFAAEKTLRHWTTPLQGYEIHHGQVVRSAADDWAGVGVRRDAVFGTHWHGLFDNDEFRRIWLTRAAAAAGRPGFVVADDIDVSARRDAQLDVMADLVQNHLDVAAVLDLVDGERRRGRPSPPVCARKHIDCAHRACPSRPMPPWTQSQHAEGAPRVGSLST